MKEETWEWEVRSMREEDPYIIHTDRDDAVMAITKFYETHGFADIYSLRKATKIIKYEEVI